MFIRTIFKKLFSPWLWINLLLMAIVAAGLLVASWHFLADYTHHGERIAVADVKGMSFSQAVLALERDGLKAVVVDSAYQPSLAPGTVLDQRPVVGKLVKSGREIMLTINTGKVPTLIIPDIADNCSMREAEAKLKSMGFKLGPVEFVPGDKDWVLGVKCRGREVRTGDRVPFDAPIVLVVGNNHQETEEELEMMEDSIDASLDIEEADE